MAAIVSELPARSAIGLKIAATDSDRGSKKQKGSTQQIGGGGDSGAKQKGIHMPDGSIWTGFYAEWDQLSKEYRQTVIDTRTKNKAKGGRKGRQVAKTYCGDMLKSIKTKMADLQRTLAAIKVKQPANDDDDDDATHYCHCGRIE